MSSPLQRFVNSFTVGLTLRTVYFSDHPSVLNAAQNVAAALAELAAAGAANGAGSVTVGHARGRLVFEGRAVIALTPLARRLIEFMRNLGAGAFQFSTAIGEEELLTLFSIYAETHQRVRLEEARALLPSRGVVHVELLPPLTSGAGSAGGRTGGTGSGGGDPYGGDATNLPSHLPTAAAEDLSEIDVEAYHTLMAVVDTNHVQAARGASIDVAGARARAEQVVVHDLQRLHDLMRLAQYPDFDAYTVGHSVRVALLVTLVTESLALPKERMIEIGAAALLHDIGKAQVPHEILYKPGALTPDERRVIEKHPTLGGEILIASGEANPWSVCAAYGHHVRHDRRGYPKLPPWVKQTSATALIHVCDVFEALTAVRPYKAAFPPWRAYDIMLRDRGAFDPAALRAFVRAIGMYPPGARVILADGSEGVVVRAGARPDRPLVQVRRRADGVALELEEGETVDLGGPEGAGREIVRLLPPDSDDIELEDGPEPALDTSLEPAPDPNAPTPAVSVDPCDPGAPVEPS